ncbi:hypothetical protein PoB_002496000 [Plakobranchus ocellatus]|uniref:Uncharacterized protein n=1 Tax=Plakobranchus ocellatus TaxID=259542 RepID=A0AAV3ZV02_9GAST|nr:hypothetical protein PoB_002496000 [Plakobranchus ocellatus]
MFHITLGISEKTERTAIQKKLSLGAVEAQKRGGRREGAVKRDKAIATSYSTYLTIPDCGIPLLSVFIQQTISSPIFEHRIRKPHILQDKTLYLQSNLLQSGRQALPVLYMALRESKRASTEITTTAYKALQHFYNIGKTKEIHLFADDCPGQNKNLIMSKKAFIYVLGLL